MSVTLPLEPTSTPVESMTGLPVRMCEVHKTFAGGTVAVQGVSLDVKPGEFVALLGPSGCGKSSLLRMIAGLDAPTKGSIERASGRVSYVFQDAHLLPWRTVLANVTLPLELHGVLKRSRIDAAMDAISAVGLSDFAKKYPAQLSGGMRMRVSLARALVTDPQLLLLDEPFAALDEITRQALDESLRDLWKRRSMTTLFVTHSIAEAAYLAQRVVVFTRRPARVMLDRTLELPADRPASIRTEAHFAVQTRALYDALVEGDR
ncbi:MAG: ABC transporter ATP-binding protein [Tepidisphaeraceae bacterium]